MPQPVPSDIVITGLGLVANLGNSPEQVLEAILAGRSALGPMAALEQTPKECKGGGQAVELPPEFRPDWPRECRYLRYAIDRALAQAAPATLDPSRLGAVLGTTLHGMRAGGRFIRTDDPSELHDFLAGAVLDRALDGLSVAGPALTTCSACSSGLAAVALAATLLRAGIIDMAIAGGYDPVSEYSYAGFDSLRLIASGEAPRPFAPDRDGMKVAEGYGVLILERAATAQAHGARVIAAIGGVGESADAFHLTQPHPDGLGAASAIRTALAAASRRIDDVAAVFAHATATPNNDDAEYAALAAVAGDRLADIPVTALKSHLGHTLGGAGAVELVLAAQCRLHGVVPPTASTTGLDPAFTSLNLVRARPLNRPLPVTLNLSLGFGGADSCVVLTDPAVQRVPPSEPRSAENDNDPVITGVGVILPGAIGNAAYIQLVSSPQAVPPLLDTGPITDEQIAAFINARRVRRMSDYVKLTLAAAAEACRHAGIEGGEKGAEFFGPCSAILATTHGSSPFCERYYEQVVREGAGSANPVLFAEGVPNAGAAQLSLMLGLRGPCQTIIGARTAAIDALALASLRIREGAGGCDRIIVGAAEEYSPVVNRAYQACGLYGGDRARHPDRFVTGSGAVALAIESRSHARRRSARILGEIGRPTWRRAGPGSVREVIDALGHTAAPVAALGPARPDRLATTALGGGDLLANAADCLPELFSVGPLAALAAILLGARRGTDWNNAAPPVVGAIAAEFSGAAAAIAVAVPAADPATNR